jgi:hypothetical protein
MEQHNYTYGKCKYNLDLICQCQEYTLNSDKRDECLLCGHNRGWHEKNYSSYLARPKMPTSANYKVLKTKGLTIIISLYK